MSNMLTEPKNSPTRRENNESDVNMFLGESRMDLQELFPDERFPNVVVSTEGTVVATWGRDQFRVRRSEDGGASWSSEIIAGEGAHGGGVTVDETNNDLLAFVHPNGLSSDAFSNRVVYRSTDDGQTWNPENVTYNEDARGNLPALHMSEHGITLEHGPVPGRLLRPARVYGKGDGYNTAIYSDDHGQTWHCSDPFPVQGTGEGAVVELSDGRIYYSSRQHFFHDGEEMRSDRLYAWSHDGGETWVAPEYDSTLPDGPRYRGEEGREACYNGHFGMAAGLTRLPLANRDILLYSNADTAEPKRIRMTVWASFNGGQTWPVKRVVYRGPSAYSSLAAGGSGTPSEGCIYLQFEEKNGPGRIARFNLAWILAGERTGDGEVPMDIMMSGGGDWNGK